MKLSPSQQFWALVQAERSSFGASRDAFNQAISSVSAKHPDIAAKVAAGPARGTSFANSSHDRRRVVAERKNVAKTEFIRRVHARMADLGLDYPTAWNNSLRDPANASFVNEMNEELPPENRAPDGACAVLGMTPGDAAECDAAFAANGRTLNAVDHRAVFNGLVDHHVGKGMTRNAAIAAVRARHPILTRAVDAVNSAAK